MLRCLKDYISKFFKKFNIKRCPLEISLIQTNNTFSLTQCSKKNIKVIVIKNNFICTKYWLCYKFRDLY